MEHKRTWSDKKGENGDDKFWRKGLSHKLLADSHGQTRKVRTDMINSGGND